MALDSFLFMVKYDLKKRPKLFKKKKKNAKHIDFNYFQYGNMQASDSQECLDLTFQKSYN